MVLTNTTGTIAFNGALITPTLTTATQGYNLSLNATGTIITNAVSFLNTGALTLGKADGTGTQTYTGGLTTTSVGGVVTVNGTLNSSNPISFGAVTLGSATAIASSGIGALGNLSFSSTVTGANTLSTTTTGATTFSGAIGTTTPLTGLTISTGSLTAGAITLVL